MRGVLPSVVVACCLLLACSSDDEPVGAAAGAGGQSGGGGAAGADNVKMPAGPALDLAEGCQPLAPEASCLLPYPSDYFRVSDAAMPSGARIVVTGAAKLVTGDGKNRDATLPDAWVPDGASLVPTLVAVLPTEISADGLPGLLDDPAKSAEMTSPTLLVNTKTGALVPHYVDLDSKAKDPTRQGIALRPFSRLDPETHYVVAVRSVQGPDGLAVPPAEGFRRLRDAEVGKDPALAAVLPRFEEGVLGPLDALGVDRASLQIAWDFTTESEARATADMVGVREKTLAWLSEHTPEVKIVSVTSGGATAWKIIKGTYQAPLFLTDDQPGAVLLRDDGGQVRMQGEMTVPFTIVVPPSVRDSFEPGQALAFGHGFFGGQSEVEGGPVREILDHTKSVGVAIDWVGMSSADLSSLADTLVANPTHGADFVDRVHQAMVNWLVLTAAVKGPLAAIPGLVRGGDGTTEGVIENPAGGGDNKGNCLYDAASVSFLGISMGHILGGVHAAVNPDISKVILNVGGGAFTHMMPRAVPFAPLFAIMASALREPLSTQAYIAMMAASLDRIDPAVYAPFVVDRPFAPSPAKRQVLMQTGLGDSQVPNIGSFLHARALGLSLTAPSARDVFGLSAKEPSSLSSALTVFAFGIDESPYAKGALAANKVHDSVRLDPQALEEMRVFLQKGSIEIDCGGPCQGTLQK
jgi:hypothetical protein